MTESVLNHKRLLVVDDEPDVLTVVEEEVLQSCPDCKMSQAKTYDEAVALLKSNDYDLVVLDIMGVRGYDLLETAVSRGFKVAMLTAHALTPEALKKSRDLGAMAYLPKDKLGELVPFLEDVLNHNFETGWRRLLSKLESYFDERFESDWKKKAEVARWYY